MDADIVSVSTSLKNAGALRSRRVTFLSGLRLAAVGVLLALSAPAFAQWKTQTISLRPGWNAVFVEVQPAPAEPADVFRDIPIESVWMWNRTFSPVQFIEDVDELVPGQPDWLVYLPPSAAPTEFTNLFAIQGGRAYLVKLGGSAPVTWNVTGTPVARPTDWLADSYNLVGFYVDPTSPPSFAEYFAPSPEHAGGAVYGLSASGHWEAVESPGTERIQPGQAYWVYCKGSSTYPGPLRVGLEQGGAVNFGRVLTEQLVRIENHSAASRQIQLRPQASAAPPDGPELAGAVPLSYWDSAQRKDIVLGAPFTVSIAPGGHLSVRLAVRRPDMAPANSPEALYQSLLEVRDNAGTLLTIPVVARGLTAASGAGGAAGGSSAGYEGLWVGTGRIDKVSFAAAPTDRTTPQPTASEMQIRLIVHVDSSGQARLLQQVTLLWHDGTTKPDPADSTKTIVDQPGRFVLVTRDDLLIGQFSGAAVRGGQQVGRRISSAAFSFATPVPLNGAFGATLTSNPIILGYDDPLNPFKHKYHPDHDNLGYDFTTQLPAGRESYTVGRTVQLTFTADDPDNLTLPGWGDTQVGGTYHEDLTGVHREAIHVSGTFRLQHASHVAVLNDGL